MSETQTALVRGVGSHNGGAELLLLASTNAVDSWHDLPVADVRHVPKRIRQAWSIGGYWGIQRLKRFPGTGLGLLPRGAATRIGLSAWPHVDYVLDASGFAYGDQWGVSNIEQVAAAAARWRRRGVPFILLPQSFGPFDKRDVRESSLRLFEQSAEVWVRDAVSLSYVTDLLGADERVRSAPDITIGVDAPAPTQIPAPGTIALIPNINLATRKPEKGDTSAYAAALVRSIELLRAQDFRAVLLVHSAHGDPSVVEECLRSRPDIEVHVPQNGLDAKAYLSRCEAVISGRFHGLVSALSSGVPAVAHSWSHKYDELMSDFGQEGLVLDPFDASASVDALVSLVSNRSAVSTQILSAKSQLRTSVSNMWSVVRATTHHSSV